MRHRSGAAGSVGFHPRGRIPARTAAPRTAQPCGPRLSGGVGRRAPRHRPAARPRSSRRCAIGRPVPASRSRKSRSGRRRRCASALQQPGITELRPGNYVYFDRTQLALGAASLDDCAMTVARDGGLQAGGRPPDSRLRQQDADDRPGARLRPTPGYGAVLTPGGRRSTRRSPSNGFPRSTRPFAPRGPTALEPGDRVRVLPNHACVVANMVDEVLLVEGDRVIDKLPVAARGKIDVKRQELAGEAERC